MNRSFFDRYATAIIIIMFGAWFVLKQLGISFLSFGQIIMIIVGFYILMYGVQMLRNSNHSSQNKEQQWSQYNPNMAPPPPPPPMNEPFSSVKSEHEAAGYNHTEEAQAKMNNYGANEYQSYHKKDYSHQSTHGEHDVINRSVFIGDLHYGKQYWELKPMNLNAFIGDVSLDLSKAHIPHGNTRIQISSFIGDVKVFVPNDVTIGVSVEMNAFIGDTKMMEQKDSGFLRSSSLQSPNFHEAERRVIIAVSTFIGDVKVKRVG